MTTYFNIRSGWVTEMDISEFNFSYELVWFVTLLRTAIYEPFLERDVLKICCWLLSFLSCYFIWIPCFLLYELLAYTAVCHSRAAAFYLQDAEAMGTSNCEFCFNKYGMFSNATKSTAESL